jgi:hypothetical protein
LPPTANLDRAEELIERCFAAVNVRVALRGTLATYPGCVHWHLKRESQPGTLEVTLWARRRRVWLAVHANRDGPWIAQAISRLAPTIERELAEQ